MVTQEVIINVTGTFFELHNGSLDRNVSLARGHRGHHFGGRDVSLEVGAHLRELPDESAAFPSQSGLYSLASVSERAETRQSTIEQWIHRRGSYTPAFGDQGSLRPDVVKISVILTILGIVVCCVCCTIFLFPPIKAKGGTWSEPSSEGSDQQDDTGPAPKGTMKRERKSLLPPGPTGDRTVKFGSTAQDESSESDDEHSGNYDLGTGSAGLRFREYDSIREFEKAASKAQLSAVDEDEVRDYDYASEGEDNKAKKEEDAGPPEKYGRKTWSPGMTEE